MTTGSAFDDPLTNLLYPSVSYDPISAALNPNIVPSGSLALIPIDMTVALMTQILVTQLSFTEDWSLRCWISQFPMGVSLLAPPSEVFGLVRFSPRPLTVFVPGQTPPANNILAPVGPGLYYLNILNLTNSASMFSFAKLDLA